MFAIRAAGIFDGHAMRGGAVTVLVRSGQIVGVEPGYPQVGADWRIVEYTGATVLPGLIDAHVHLCGDSASGALDRLADFHDDHLQAVIEAALRRQLAAGVTTVRDLGDRHWSAVAWRDRQRGAGLPAPLPTIIASGPPITSVGGHCWSMGGQAEGADALRAAIRERAERRADVVKIMASGGVMTPGTDVMHCQFTLEDMRFAVTEAHRHGLPVTAHAHGLPAVELAVQAGVDGIEHCTCLTETGIDLPDPLLNAIVTAGITVCPTLGKAPDAVPVPRLREMMQRTGMTFEKRQTFAAGLALRGVNLVSGSDAGISAGKPHGILPEAVTDLVAGGMPASEALASATSAAARACGVGDAKGQVKPGFDADLLVIQGDPTTDIRNLGKISAVVVQGSFVSDLPAHDPSLQAPPSP